MTKNHFRVLVLLLILIGAMVIYPIYGYTFEQRTIAHNQAIHIESLERLLAALSDQGVISNIYEHEESLGGIMAEVTIEFQQTTPEPPAPPTIVLRWAAPADSPITMEMFRNRLDIVLMYLQNPSRLSDQTLATLVQVLIRMTFFDDYSEIEFLQGLTDEVLRRVQTQPMPSLDLVSAFLYLWMYHIEHSDNTSAFESLFDTINHSLVENSYFGASGARRYSAAYVAGLFQKTSSMQTDIITQAQRTTFSLIADFHIQMVIDEADFTMGVPIWPNVFGTIYIDSHLEHLHGYMLYRQFGGGIQMSATRNQLNASTTLFIDARAGEANRHYASGFHAHSAQYEGEDSRPRATLINIAKHTMVANAFGGHRLAYDATHDLLIDYRDETGMIYRLGSDEKPNDPAALDAWMLFVYSNFLNPTFIQIP